MSTLTLDDAKAHLGITGATSDIELQDTIDAAEAAISRRVGPLEPVTKTWWVTGGGRAMVLPVAPVVSVTSMISTDTTPYTATLTGLTLDADSGIVAGITGDWYTTSTYVITYVAGRTTVPDDLLYAVKEMTRHLWRTQRGAGGRPGAAGADQQQTPGYLIPYAVAELLEPYMLPGFA